VQAAAYGHLAGGREVLQERQGQYRRTGVAERVVAEIRSCGVSRAGAEVGIINV